MGLRIPHHGRDVEAMVTAAPAAADVVLRAADPLTTKAPTTTDSCSELAKDPTSDPLAYAMACAHHFGTQIPPYTDGPHLTSSRRRRTSKVADASTVEPVTQTTIVSSRTTITTHLPMTSSALDPTQDPQEDNDGNKTHVGTIGGVVAGFAAISLIGAALYWTRKKWFPTAKAWLMSMNADDTDGKRCHYQDETFHSERKSYSTYDSFQHQGSLEQPGPTSEMTNSVLSQPENRRTKKYSLTNPDPPSSNGSTKRVPSEVSWNYGDDMGVTVHDIYGHVPVGMKQRYYGQYRHDYGDGVYLDPMDGVGPGIIPKSDEGHQRADSIPADPCVVGSGDAKHDSDDGLRSASDRSSRFDDDDYDMGPRAPIRDTFPIHHQPPQRPSHGPHKYEESNIISESRSIPSPSRQYDAFVQKGVQSPPSGPQAYSTAGDHPLAQNATDNANRGW
jgi:hypothetical protein